MASRNQNFDALILSVKPQGENNRNVCLLSPEEGIVWTTLWGGGKSRLKSLVVPFNRGHIWIYRDETKNMSKITDFDVKNYHLTFRENLFKTWAASFACELVIKTKGAGSYSECYQTVNGFLDGMELCDENDSRLGFIRFIWRFIGILGIKPSSDSCCHCGTSFIAGKITPYTVQYKAAYDESVNGFSCASCCDISHRTYLLGKPALTYLEALSTLSPKDVRSIIIDERSMQEMKTLGFHLLESACGSKLKSIQTGTGIL